jgi:hypothetical protein
MQDAIDAAKQLARLKDKWWPTIEAQRLAAQQKAWMEAFEAVKQAGVDIVQRDPRHPLHVWLLKQVYEREEARLRLLATLPGWTPPKHEVCGDTEYFTKLKEQSEHQ